MDVLDEVELLVAAVGGPEIAALDIDLFFLRFAIVVDDGDAALLAEGRIGQHHVHQLGLFGEAVAGGDQRLVAAQAMQIEVHGAQARHVGHDVVAVNRLLVDEFLGFAVEPGLVQKLVGGQQEAAGAAGRIGDAHVRLGPHRLDDGADDRTRREILAGPAAHVLGIAGQQTLINLAFHVHVHAGPVLALDHG